MSDGTWMILDKVAEEAAWNTYREFKKRTDLKTRVYRLPENFVVYEPTNRSLILKHNLAILRAFREALGDQPELLVLDRHHECYRLDVSVPMETLVTEDEVWGMKMYAEESYQPMWRQPVIPEGDSVSFFSPNRSLIYEYEYSDDPAASIEITGEALIAAIEHCGSPLLT